MAWAISSGVLPAAARRANRRCCCLIVFNVVQNLPRLSRHHEDAEEVARDLRVELGGFPVDNLTHRRCVRETLRIKSAAFVLLEGIRRDAETRGDFLVCHAEGAATTLILGNRFVNEASD